MELPLSKARVAVVHYWLVGMRGGERFLECVLRLFPNADVFTLFLDPNQISDFLRTKTIRTSFLQRFPGPKYYKYALPLMPWAVEKFDLSAYDLVISSESGPAKAVITSPESLHICYCHSPMRYIWDQRFTYTQDSSLFARVSLSTLSPLLRMWDASTASRVDKFISNSTYVKDRIMKYYRRDSDICFPPVRINRDNVREPKEDYFIIAGQIVPYKRVDLAVDAFNVNGLPLVILGAGAEKKLRERAKSNIRFVVAEDDGEFRRWIAKARALIYPGLEDFGIIPVEAISLGTPVIAYGRGGARDTVTDGVSGVFFAEQTVEALSAAVAAFIEREASFDRDAMMASIARFSEANFTATFMGIVAREWERHQRRRDPRIEV